MAQKRYGIAKQIFDIQNHDGGVPSHILAAARRLMAGGESVTDAALCLNFLGAKKTGAGLLRKNAGVARSYLSTIGTYANYAGTISQGGMPSIGAGLGLVDRVSGDVVSLLKSSQAKAALKEILVPLLSKKNGPLAAVLKEAIATVTGAEKITGGAQAATKILLSMRGAARYAGALARTAGTIGAFAYAGGYIGNTFGSLIAGDVNIENRRLLNQQTNLALSDSMLSAGRRQLARLNFLSADNRLHGLGAVPLVGGYFAARLDARAGFDARTKGELETGLDLNEAQLGKLNAVQLRELASGRYFRGKSVTTTGALLEEGYENLDRNGVGAGAAAGVKAATGLSIKFRPSEETQQGITAKGQEALKKAKELEERFESQILNRRFSDARETARQANLELPGTVSKEFSLHPENAYRAYEGARVANRMWVISNSPHAGARDWDH